MGSAIKTYHASDMKSLFLATVCIACSLSLGIVEAQNTPPGHDPVSLHKKTKFRDPLQVKKIILECDTDKSGELSTEEFAKCEEKDVKTLDINGDLRVERHEIKQAVKLASPDMEKDRKTYLDEIARFKDIVKACDKITPDSSRGDGEIDFKEGQACLNENPQYKKLFEEIDENKDGNLVKHELRDHVQRVRERNHVASGQNTRGGPTTPMN